MLHASQWIAVILLIPFQIPPPSAKLSVLLTEKLLGISNLFVYLLWWNIKLPITLLLIVIFLSLQAASHSGACSVCYDTKQTSPLLLSLSLLRTLSLFFFFVQCCDYQNNFTLKIVDDFSFPEIFRHYIKTSFQS